MENVHQLLQAAQEEHVCVRHIIQFQGLLVELQTLSQEAGLATEDIIHHVN